MKVACLQWYSSIMRSEGRKKKLSDLELAKLCAEDAKVEQEKDEYHSKWIWSDDQIFLTEKKSNG